MQLGPSSQEKEEGVGVVISQDNQQNVQTPKVDSSARPVVEFGEVKALFKNSIIQKTPISKSKAFFTTRPRFPITFPGMIRQTILISDVVHLVKAARGISLVNLVSM